VDEEEETGVIDERGHVDYDNGGGDGTTEDKGETDEEDKDDESESDNDGDDDDEVKAAIKDAGPVQWATIFDELVLAKVQRMFSKFGYPLKLNQNTFRTLVPSSGSSTSKAYPPTRS
jgi:hypothetical protein